MKTIYTVTTSNIKDKCYYSKLQDAMGFVQDQVEMDYACEVKREKVTEVEYKMRMTTMSASAPRPAVEADAAFNGIPTRGSNRPDEYQGEATHVTGHAVDEKRLRYPEPEQPTPQPSTGTVSPASELAAMQLRGHKLPPPSSAGTAKLERSQRTLLIDVKNGNVSTHRGSSREFALKELERIGLVYQGHRSSWHLTERGIAECEALTALARRS